MTATKEKRAKKNVKRNSDDNAFSMYLREINRIPLLSKEEEEKAARAAAGGNLAARNRLVNANLRFVVNVAKKYQGQGISLADLVSEGNIGLLDAAGRFEVDRGYRFITYAVWWIRQAITKAICEKGKMIRLPANRGYEAIQIEKVRRMIEPEQMSADDEIREIAAFLNMDKAHVEDMLFITRDMVSLEIPLRQGGILGDMIEDEQSRTPEQAAVHSALKVDIEQMLDTLNDKEATVLRGRYGLGKNGSMSLEELGRHYNLTKERIRQIEEKAITRLQAPHRMEQLEAYVA